MKETILIFHQNAPEAEVLKGVLSGAGYSAQLVSPSKYSQPLGVLAGEDLMGFPTGLNQAPAAPVMVFCHMAEEDVDNALALLRQSGLGRNVLKAILTPTNRFWTVSILAQELEKERRMMGG